MLSSTQLLSTANPRPGTPPSNSANLGGELFFGAADAAGNELWKTDGTAAGTVIVKDINPGSASSSPTSLVNVGNVIFFSADDGTNGTELWKTDGTAAGMVMVKDIVPGSGSSYPANLTNVNGKLFFTARDVSGQNSLWTSDGTAGGTVELATVTASQLTNFNGTLFFAGSDPAHGAELWKSDGTPGGTVLVKDIAPGTSSSNPQYLTVVNSSEMFFNASDSTSRTPTPELWKTDGTSAGTVLVKQVNTRQLYAFNGSLFFDGPDAVGGTQYDNLWKSDGTSDGTVQVTEAHRSDTSFAPVNYATLNGTLIVAAYSEIRDTIELYKTDGTEAGTVRIAPGLALVTKLNNYESTLIVANGLLYFISIVPGTGSFAVYQTDGTAAGTVRADPTAGSLVTPIHLMGPANNTLVFAGVAPTDPFPLDFHEKVYGMSIPPAPTGAATFVRADSSTSGSWRGVYGSDGYDLLDGPASLPVYAQVSAGNASQWLWVDPTSDTRALQDPAPSTARTAACDYAAGSFTLDVNLTDGQMHQVALYLVDFDGRGRIESVQVSDAGSGQVLDTQSVSNFQNGRWFVYDLSGHVTITLTNTGSVNAVASNLMFDAVAQPGTDSFTRIDTTTLGGWIGTYGSGGYSVVGGATNVPASVQLSVSGAQQYTWADPVADPRALKIGAGTQGRTAAADYSAGGFTLDLNLTDGQPHRVAFYLLDFDALGRSEAVEVSDAATGTVLSFGTFSNFQGGQYIDYTLSGHVKVTFINYGNGRDNAVLSGVFVDPVPAPPILPTATFIRTDAMTQGQWTGTYGTQGYDVIGGTESLPAYAALTVNNSQFYQWDASTTDPTGLQTSPGSTSRVAACDYSNASSFSISLNLTDGKTHQVALYLLDWDHQKRTESIDIADAATGTGLAGTDDGSFSTGHFDIFNIAGNVTITIKNAGGLNEVVSGIFIDPVKIATASFVKTDTTTQGTWTGAYGNGGYDVVAGSVSPNFPELANPIIQNFAEYTYAASTSDPRALQSSPGSTGRVEAVDYAPTYFTFNLNLTDGKTHQLALYVADYDSQGRSETIQLADARSGAALDTQFVSNFQGGKYLVWNVSGDLNITFTQVGGPNAVVSGVFLD